jgi:hypothetical protein
MGELPPRHTCAACSGLVLEPFADPVETSCNSARDRAVWNAELIRDVLVCLVAKVEAIDHLPAMRRQARDCLLNRQHFFQMVGSLAVFREKLGLASYERLVRSDPQSIDAQSARDLPDPGTDCTRIAQPAEVLEGPCECLLKDVLSVFECQSEGASSHRVDRVGKAIDELVPGVVFAASASAYEFRVRDLTGGTEDSMSMLA